MTDDNTPIPPRVRIEKIRIQEDAEGLYIQIEHGRNENGYSYMKFGE